MTTKVIKNQKKIKFQKSPERDFYSEVKHRVHRYFEKNGISPHANSVMILKNVLIFIVFITAYALMITNTYGPVGVIISYAVIGVTIALIGFNLAHDALHGSLSSKNWINRAVGYIFDFNGTSSYVWRITHNIKHHTFTNIHGEDEDIDKMILLRFSPSDDRYGYHRFQHIYATVLYALLAVRWVYFADYPVMIKQMINKQISLKDSLIFFGFKTANLLYYIVIPLLVLNVSWEVVIAGVFIMHATTSILLSYVFQLAHIVENVEHPLPNTKGEMKDDWATHEMKTTSNFGTNNTFLTQMVGGLNFQVEHHLFTKVCHVHYPEISKIVRETAKEYQVPYNEQPTFTSALKSHFSTLKKLGCGEI